MEANSLITEDDVKGRYAVFMDMELLYTALPRREGLRATTPTTCKEAATQGYFHDEFDLVGSDALSHVLSRQWRAYFGDPLGRGSPVWSRFAQLARAPRPTATATPQRTPSATGVYGNETDFVDSENAAQDGYGNHLPDLRPHRYPVAAPQEAPAPHRKTSPPGFLAGLVNRMLKYDSSLRFARESDSMPPAVDGPKAISYLRISSPPDIGDKLPTSVFFAFCKFYAEVENHLSNLGVGYRDKRGPTTAEALSILAQIWTTKGAEHAVVVSLINHAIHQQGDLTEVWRSVFRHLAQSVHLADFPDKLKRALQSAVIQRSEGNLNSFVTSLVYITRATTVLTREAEQGNLPTEGDFRQCILRWISQFRPGLRDSLVFRVDEFASLTSTDLIEQLERVQDAQLAFPELDPAVTHAATATAVARPAAPRARLVAHMTDNVSTDEVKDDGHSALLALPEGEASDNANGGQVATRTQRREDGPSRPPRQLTGAQRRDARACAEELHTSRLAYLADLHVFDDDTEADSCGDQLFALGEERLAVLDKGVTADGRLLDHAVHRTQLSRGPQGQRRPGNDVCYACGKRGHWARECRAGKRTAQDATRPPATLAALSALQRQLLPMQGPLALDEGL